MLAGDPSNIPNPFSAQARSKPPAKRLAWTKAWKTLVLVAVGLSVTVVIGSQNRRWLVFRLTEGFESCTPVEKRQRLLQISELGAAGIPSVVRAMNDDDIDVARTAYDLLRHSQSEWTTLKRKDTCRHQEILIDSLQEIAVHLPDDRTGWASGLLHPVILDCVNQSDETSRQLYNRANQTLEMLALSERPGPSVLSHQPLEPLIPQRLSVPARPLPVAASQPADSWTDWPPSAQPIAIGVASPQPAELTSEQPTEAVSQSPSVYRSSSMQLRPLPPDEAVVLRELSPSETALRHETSYQPPPAEIRPVANLVDSPMETLDDRSVMQWLGSPHLALREKAKLELIRRGYTGSQITVATRLASDDVRVRMELVDVIARDGTIDPRPWLVMLLDDESRDVQLRAISVLATMNDPAVNQELRMRLVDQTDPIIAARLRRVLNLR